jgi:hypothetical protein
LIPRKALIWITAALVLSVIVGSFLPLEAKKAIGTHGTGGAYSSASAPVTSGHRIYHFVSFGLVAFCALALARNRAQEIANAMRVLGLGVAIELVQWRVSHSYIEWWDVRDDAIGIAVAFAVMQWRGLRPKLVRD